MHNASQWHKTSSLHSANSSAAQICNLRKILKTLFHGQIAKINFRTHPGNNKRSVKRIPCVSISPAANKSKNQENILKSTTFYNRINLREQSSPADNKPPFYADDFCKNMQKFSAFFISAKAGKNIYVGMYCSGYLLALPVISTLGIRIAGMATPGKNKRLPV